jgi:hypothetical protein
MFIWHGGSVRSVYCADSDTCVLINGRLSKSSCVLRSIFEVLDAALDHLF